MSTRNRVRSSFPFLRLVTGRRAAALLLTASSLALTACSDDDDDGPTGSGGIAGTYNIASVTGPEGQDNSAPFLILSDELEGIPFTAEIVSGSITLAANGTYTGTQQFRVTVTGIPAQTQTNSDAGTYTVSGSTVTLVSADDPSTPDDDDPADRTSTATYSGGNTLTVSEQFDLDDDGVADGTLTIVARK